MTPSSRSTRREFLQGKAALAVASEVAWTVAPPGDLPQPAGECYLLKLARRAMACEFEVFFNAGQYACDTEAALAALDLVDAVEDQLTVYREHSEVSRLNARAAGEPVSVEARLFALIELAVRIHAASAGAYDITAGPLSTAWGFTRRSGSVPAPAAIAAALACVGSQYLELDSAAGSIRFLRPGVGINLGSIGKGYALDRCAELLTACGIDNFLLHGGNSSVLGRGAHGSSGGEQGWSVGVRDPLRPDRRLGLLRLKNRALATSGSGTQFFIHDSKRYGHILDPRSGWPAEGVLSVSVLAPSAAEADALSTAFYVMGPADSASYCREHPEIAAVMLTPGLRAGSIEKHFWGLDPSDWTELDAS